MSQPPTISLAPLSIEWHVPALQQVYLATPGYWQLFNFLTVPPGQAEHDLQTVAETPGRTLLGIVRQTEQESGAEADQTGSVELVGVLDFRLHWPSEHVVYVGMVMVAEPYQRQGIGTQAWALLKPWLVEQAKMQRARLAVEPFNPTALQFFESLGFTLTGESDRIKVGDKFVRLMYMELTL